ncbi:MAG TPA: rod shape-determining protein RodA [Terriglobales bacterium]|nr:rod shape-determining protein RodA [Terriglobales bacterium]
MRRFISFRDFDWILLAFILIICAVGTFEIYSATRQTKFVGFQTKQVYWIIGGLILMFFASMVNYQALLENVHWFYIASILSLLAVAAVGTRVLGAKRWIKLPGGQHFQPSEWIKLVLILTLAKYFSDLAGRDVGLRDIVKAFLIVGVPMALVLKQPDLGTSLTYIPVLICALFLGGIKFKHAISILLLGTLMIYPVWRWGLKPYQKARLTSFSEPEADPRGSGYQIQQSLIAVGSGGLTGKGSMKGSQTQGAFIPIPYTDFIFAAFAEEHGFVGCLVVLLLYFIVLMRLIQNAQSAPDRAGTLIIMGVVAVLVFHILVNVGMVVGYMPVTGIPLPLMSYGGSSVLFTFLALGIVNNIRMRRFVN